MSCFPASKRLFVGFQLHRSIAMAVALAAFADATVFSFSSRSSDAQEPATARPAPPAAAAVAAPTNDAPIQYGEPRQIATLESADVQESSGLTVSNRRSDLFWTHNDSGDLPRVYAFDRTGKVLAACHVVGAAAIDWEDMAGYSEEDRPYLILADVGDNRRLRNSYKLYVIEEPTLEQKSTPVVRTLRFTYEDGPHDCEAIGVDPTSNTVLLCTKVLGLTCELFQIELNPKSQQPQVARVIAKPAITAVTAMTVSPDGRRAVLATYGDAFEFHRAADETWRQAFARRGRLLAMPGRKQGEAICYGADGKTLYLTSEKRPTPLWEVPATSSK